MEETTRRVMDDCMDEEHDAVLVDVDRGTSCASSVRSFSFGDAEDDEMTRIPDGNSMEDAGEVLPTTNDSLVSGEMTDDDAREIARTLLEAYDAATSRDELDRMVDAMKVYPIPAGEVVVANVDDLECLYIIQDGEIQLVVDRADSSGLMLRPGDHFGSFVDVELPSNVVVVATKTSVLWVLENVDFQLICFDSTSSLAGAQIERMTHLRLVEAFVTLSDDQIADLAVSLEPAVYQDGDCIIRQGDIGDYFYIIQEGQVICKSTCSSLARHRGSEEVARISSGDYFGEIALLNGMPRTASVYADGIVKCLRLSRDAFTTLLGPLIEVFEQRHLLRTFMAIPEFAGLTVDQLQFVLAELEVEMYYEGECIFTEGDEADALFIIKSGFVCLMSDHEDLASASAKPHGLALTANDPFGFESLGAMNRRYASTAIASADVQVLILRRSIHRNALPAQIENLQLSDDVSADRSLLDALLAQNKAGEIRPVHDETAPPIWDVSERYQSTPLDLFENVQLHRLKKGPSISKGVMADIRLTNVEGSDDLFILKEMSIAKLVSDGLQIHPLREKSALMEIRPHPMIVKLYKTFQDRHHLYSLLEYVPGGELFQFCINTPQLSDETVRFCAANAILGLQHIHSEGFIYRNMRPENLLLGADGYIKFVDFAFAKRLPFTAKGIGGEEETHTRTYTICGTPDYLAPEIIMGKGHDRMVDYWTLGVMIYELLVGCAPFAVMDSNMVERYERVLAVGSGRNPVTFPTNAAVSTEARDLINQLLRGPSNRLGSGDRGAMVVREHAWFSSVDWERMLSKDLPAPTRPRNSSRKIRLPDEYFGLSNTEDETGHFAGF